MVSVVCLLEDLIHKYLPGTSSMFDCDGAISMSSGTSLMCASLTSGMSDHRKFSYKIIFRISKCSKKFYILGDVGTCFKFENQN